MNQQRSTVAGVADQLISSAGNFALLLLVARTTSAREFGFFALAFAFMTLGIGVGRSALGSVVGLDAIHANENSYRESLRRSSAASLILGCCFTCVLLIASLPLAGRNDVPVMAIVVLAFAGPALLLQDFCRFMCVARGRTSHALWSDAVWTFVTGACFVVSLIAPLSVSGGSAVLAWVAGLHVGLLVFIIAGSVESPMWRGTPRWLAKDSRRPHLALDATLRFAGPLALSLAVTFVLDPTAVAGLRGAWTLLGPVTVLVTAVPLVITPQASRRESGARAYLARTSILLASATAAWGLILSVMPSAFGRTLLGPTWEVASPVLPYLALECAAVAAVTGAIVLLQLTRRTGVALNTRLWYTLTSVAAPTAAGLVIGTTISVAIALVATATVYAAVSWYQALEHRP